MKKIMDTKYILFLIIFLSIPSSRAIFKYLPYPEIISLLYLFFCVLFFLLILNLSLSFQWMNKAIDKSYITYTFFAISGAISYFIYPIADARKEFGMGSTGDDAIIEPVLTLLTDEKLYSPILYDGAPISPGPGWILQNTPFVLLDVFWLLSIFYIALFAVVARFYLNSFREINISLILISSSLIFWELLATGHDLIAVSFCFVTFSLAVFKQSLIKKDNFKIIIPLAIALGLFSTSRAFFICFPVLLSVFLWKFNKRNGVILLFFSLATAFLLHGYFYFYSDYYQPLHLFERGSRTVGGYITSIGLISTLTAFLLVYKKLENSMESWVLSVFICLSIPLFFIATGELIYSDYSFSEWEGGNYLLVSAPLLVFFTALRSSR